MRRIALTAVVLLGLGLVLLLSLDFYVAETASAADFTVMDIDGNDFTLSDNRGKIVLLEFMTIDCPSCADQTEKLKPVREKYDETEVIIISLSVSPLDNASTLQDYRNAHQADWMFAADVEDVAYSYGVDSVPHMCIISGDGRIASTYSGPPLGADEVSSRIDQAIFLTDPVRTIALPVLSLGLILAALCLLIFLGYTKRSIIKEQLFGGAK
ncbi:MAG: TlpA family protein disulfide reductase [Thermoplasmata archaeon]